MMDWPESEELNNLKRAVFKKLGRELVLLDAEEHESGVDIICRYEHDAIYCRSGLPSYATLFCIAHELGHAWQEAVGILRFRLKNEFRRAFEFHEGKDIKKIVQDLHTLSDRLSALIKDRGADSVAKLSGLYSEEAVKYFMGKIPYDCSKESKTPSIQIRFNPDEFRNKLSAFAGAIESKKQFHDSSVFEGMRFTLRCAIDYANRWLRLNEFNLISNNTALFSKYYETIHQVGTVLVNTVATAFRDFNSVEQCYNIEIELANYLGLDPIFEIRA